MHRFYVKHPLKEGPLMLDDAALAHQVCTVLRMKASDEIMLFSGGEEAGWDFRFRLTRVTNRVLDGTVLERVKSALPCT